MRVSGSRTSFHKCRHKRKENHEPPLSNLKLIKQLAKSKVTQLIGAFKHEKLYLESFKHLAEVWNHNVNTEDNEKMGLLKVYSVKLDEIHHIFRKRVKMEMHSI